MTRCMKDDRGPVNAVRAGLPLLVLLATVIHGVAEEFRMEVSQDLAGNYNFYFPSDTNFYYILYQGQTVTKITTPCAMLLGQNGWDHFVVSLPPPGGAGSAFFRIGKVPINQSLDSDGDGIPDVWELEHQLDPLNPADAALVDVGDGLTYLEEYLLGDNPQIVTVVEVTGASATNQLGHWAVDGDTTYDEDRRGFVEYSMAVPTADIFRLEVEGRERFFRDPATPLVLLISIDGDYLGRVALTYGATTNGLAWTMTPWLNPGAHTVRIYWDNAASDRSLLIKALRLQVLVGPDTGGNGIKDWVASRLQTLCGVEVGGAAAPPLISAATSPYCLEGRERYLGTLRLSVGIDGSAAGATNVLAASHGAGYRWYADVPLSPANLTRVESSFQNGGLQATNWIIWQPTNLLTNDNLAVRVGDALLLTAAPPGATRGSVSITVVGVTNYTTDWASAVPHAFAVAGTYTVTGSYTSDQGDSTNRSITVQVVSASFDGNPAAWAGQTRVLECPDLPAEAVVESDPGVQWSLVSPITNWGNRFFLTINSTDPHYLVARLGNAGPILANATIDGFEIYSSSQTYVKLVQLYSDGSQLVEMLVVQSPLVSSVLIQLDIFVPGVTFDDGTITKTLSASDFDVLGQCPVRFIRPMGVTSSVCHYLRATQVGSPYWLGER